MMNEQISYTGHHPLEAVVAELKNERAEAIARAEAFEKALLVLKDAYVDNKIYAYVLEMRVAELEAKLAAFEGWEVPDGVEYPVGHVDVLVVREAVWRDGIEEWEDTRSDLYLHGVIAYRDKPRRDSGEEGE